MTVNGAAQGTAIPVPPIPFRPVLDRDACTVNARRNLARGYPKLQQLPEFGKPKHSAIAIVGGGPSLLGKLDALRGFRTIMACASVHDFLVSKWIFPRYAVILDPVATGNLHYFQLPVDTCTYLVASHAEPAVLEAFSGYPMALWNAMGEVGDKSFGKDLQVMGGSTALLRAIVMAVHMGWTEQHLFGIDSCYAEGESHAYKVDEPMSESVRITVQGGRTFDTTSAWVLQARQFFDTLTAMQGAFHPTIHGDGLIPEMVRRGNPEFAKHIKLA